MRQQLEGILAEVAAKHADKRLHIFDVQIRSAEANRIALAGRVLEQRNLDELRQAMQRAAGAANIDDAQVTVVRKSPPVLRTIATNITDLHKEPSFLAEMLTQVTNGAQLEILEQHDKWALVRQTDGYLGWAYLPYMTETQPAAFTHMVQSPMSPLIADPAKKLAPLTRLLAGTHVCVTDARDGWCRIQPAGDMLPSGWTLAQSLRSLASLPMEPEVARQDMVASARNLTGVYYLWGGCSVMGIDCSGLAQLAHRLAGYTIPRDASLQYPAGRVIEEPFLPGDLLFFYNDERTRIGHVGISTGGWNIIHASRSRNGVYEEDVKASESLTRTFAGARSFLPS
ncbi:MAG TPA: NlpC/P60 family protein [Tepidisphaeraceae bacterium]